MNKNCLKCNKEISGVGKSGMCISCVMTGKKRPDMIGNQFRKGISPPWKGQKIGPLDISEKERIRRSKQARKNFSETMFKKGQSAWNKGMSAVWVKGDKNPNWKGGATKKNAEERRSPEMKKWRMLVLVRDNFICQLCGVNNSFHADHIKSFADFPELRYNIDNGRTLCENCHKNTPTYLKNIKTDGKLA